ncbi:hypothetical protein [Dyadobacter sp. CY323]|uniref:hypothetical protein n=1 Tax=Dyadobacter sp. CY323 TaxID=2907302 RepID=UPI001F25667E|nr:hypothetical protein [Dyadobacter sp. CY323]MCE6992463.1 hypothetical protein [Dyadobacter sp. CY323]
MSKIVAFCSTLLLLAVIGGSVSGQSWPKVKDVDLSKLSPNDFKDDELDLPYYLKHFHTVANSVIESGPDKGYISLAVWRRPVDNKPYNARIMENILSLAYFYATDRPWNPYFKSEAVKVRMEAALEFWLRMQHSSGKFSEYGPEKWNLAGTSFATLCMGRTLELLQKSGGIDARLFNRVKAAQRKAIMFVLDDEEVYEHGKNYTNQYTASFPGALAYLKMYPEKEMQDKFERRLEQTGKDFQSPAGFFYEAGGTDHGYNMNTHHSNSRIMYDYTHGKPMARAIEKEEEKFVEWLAFNAVKEPGSKYFTLNRGTETRTPAPVVANYIVKSPLGEHVELLRAFTPAKEEITENNRNKRKVLTEKWPDVGKLDTYSPTNLLHLNRYQWNPSKAQQAAAMRKLPYLSRERFTHQRVDSKVPVVFTFVKRKNYYAAFNSGKVTSSRQRYGIGLLWDPVAGTFLQSHAATKDAAWGTKGPGDLVYEAKDLFAEMRINGERVNEAVGNRDLELGVLTVHYPLGEAGKKELTFQENEIRVNVTHQAAFKEFLPLLVHAKDEIDISRQGVVTISKNGKQIEIVYDSPEMATLQKTDIKSGDQDAVTIVISARDKLTYTIKM